MKVIYRRCAGLDVHEKSVSVCARIVEGKKAWNGQSRGNVEDLLNAAALQTPAARWSCVRAGPPEIPLAVDVAGVLRY